MRNNWGSVPLGSVIPFFFDTFGTNGESLTLTGLAAGDIEVYKGTSMTQRASDNGFTLLDTDGIDIDSRTGIHGFSIDTGDNSDSGFYAAGSFYTVVVDGVTVNSQTVRFVAGTFRLVAAENTAGVPVSDAVRVGGTAQTGRDIGASVLLSAGTGTGQINLASGNVTVGTNSDKTGYSLSQAFPSNFAALSITAGGLVDITQAAADKAWGTATRLLTAGTNIALAKGTGVTGFTDLDAAGVRGAVGLASADLDTQLSGINSKTTNLPSDPADASDIAALFDALPTAAENASAVRTELSTELGRVDAAISTRATPAQVNAEVVYALATDTYAEPGQGTPGATISLSAKIGYIYKAWRNRSTMTASEYALYGDDAVTKDQEATFSDNGTTADRGEVATGA